MLRPYREGHRSTKSHCPNIGQTLGHGGQKTAGHPPPHARTTRAFSDTLTSRAPMGDRTTLSLANTCEAQCPQGGRGRRLEGERQRWGGEGAGRRPGATSKQPSKQNSPEEVSRPAVRLWELRLRTRVSAGLKADPGSQGLAASPGHRWSSVRVAHISAGGQAASRNPRQLPPLLAARAQGRPWPCTRLLVLRWSRTFQGRAGSELLRAPLPPTGQQAATATASGLALQAPGDHQL